MPATVVAVGTVVLGNTSTLTPAIPSGVQEGDLLLALGYHRSAVTFTCSTSGWTERYDPGSQSTGSWCLYTATYTTGLANPTIVASASQSFLAVIIAVRGADTTNIFDVNPSASAFTAPASPYNVTLASFNTNYDGSLAFFGWGSTDDNTWAYQSGGGTQRASDNETAGQDASFCIVTKEMPTAGAVGDQVARETTNGGDAGRRFWFAVRAKVYILSAESGSVGLSGQAAGTLKASLVTAESGGFQTVGQDVLFAKGMTMAADPGLCQLTGQSAELLRLVVIAANSGAYQLTGQSAGLVRIVSVVADTGLYQLAGQSADLRRWMLVIAYPGSYQLTGQSAGLLRSVSIVTDSGTYQLTGQNAELLRSILLLGSSGLYAVVGQDATLTKILSHILSAEFGSYSVVGEQVWLLNVHELSAGSAFYNITGHDAGITRSTLFVAENGIFATIGQDIKILRSLHVVAEPSVITVTGQNTWIKIACVLIADSGDYLVMGYPALLEHSGIVYIPYIIYFPREELNMLIEMTHVDISIENIELRVKIISEHTSRFLS